MLTHLQIRNFKRLRDVEIPLGKAVVLIGPNNSGKTTALQALALWDVGMRAWNAKRGEGKSSPEKRPGVAINRRDLISTPVPVANLLWHGLHVRRAKTNGGERGTQNIRIDISVSGITGGKEWTCGFEFDFTNDESFVCRPLRLSEFENVPVTQATFSEIPIEASNTRFAFLPPMSGLTAEEPLLQPERVSVLMGQGETAQVLRNLCYRVVENDRENQRNDWGNIASQIEKLFGTKILEPVYPGKRGEITLEYKENGIRLDISASGRGFQQTLLLLAHLHSNPNTVLLLDEPDAHLEILRQRETFRVIAEVAGQQGSQIIAASHSEVVLNEAASMATVVAFVGQPHLLNTRTSQALKSLTSIGWDQYYQAEQTGWVLYLEGSTDLAILQVFAKSLNHDAQPYLDSPFVKYVGNQPQNARDHFFGLQEAKNDLVGIAIFDRLDRELQPTSALNELMWQRNEIENYFCMEEVLFAYARHDLPGDLFRSVHEQAMREAIAEVTDALQTLNRPGPWSHEVKATDEFLDPLFKKFFQKLKRPLALRKSDYHTLSSLAPKERLDPEITEKLDAIVAVAREAKPADEVR